jgi:hypothetical protein
MKKFSLVVLLLIISLISLVLPAPAPAQDLLTNLDLEYVIVPTSGTTDITSSAISTANYQATLLALSVTGNATWTADAKIDFIMTHAATSGGTYYAVEASDIRGATPDENGVIMTLDEVTDSTTNLGEIQYRGRWPYFKIKADFTGVATDTPTVSVLAIQGGKIIAGP